MFKFSVNLVLTHPFHSKIASDSILSAMQKTVKTPELLEIIQEAKTEKTTFNYDVLENLRKLVPVFFGIRVIEGFEYLKLSRIGAKLGNLEKVSTCDVKIGKVFYDPDADEKKVLGQTAGKNYWPVRTEMGYQFQGISLFSETGIVRYEKTKLTNEVTKIEDSRIPIDYFFPESLSSVKLENIVEGILTKLNEIIKFFEHINNCVQFYASSVLIVYDAETCDCDVKMIDFAHVFYEKEFKDENYS